MYIYHLHSLRIKDGKVEEEAWQNKTTIICIVFDVSKTVVGCDYCNYSFR